MLMLAGLTILCSAVHRLPVSMAHSLYLIAFVRVDDKKELIDPPRIQEKEFKEPERISLRTPKDLELKKQSKSLFFFV
jgi:hypothetical protein